MTHRETIAGGLLLIGFPAVAAGSFLENFDIVAAGVVLAMLGVFIIPWNFEESQEWYCAACGQYLGEGKQPNDCTRCGSNRVTTEDPGVGRAVRVQDNRRRR